MRTTHTTSPEQRLIFDNRNACTEARRRLEAAGLSVTAETIRRDRRGFSLTVEVMVEDEAGANNLATVMQNIRLNPAA